MDIAYILVIPKRQTIWRAMNRFSEEDYDVLAYSNGSDDTEDNISLNVYCLQMSIASHSHKQSDISDGLCLLCS